MKSNICALTGEKGQMEAVLTEVDKCAAYNGLNGKSALRARLLAEELVGMLPDLLKEAEGSFWMENNGKKYEMHVSVRAKETGVMTRERLLAVSTSGKNAAATGIMGKIRAAAEMMLFPAEEDLVGADFYDFGLETSVSYGQMWSLSHYVDRIQQQAEAKAKEDAWDELEKSIVSKLADDVIVGIKGKQVDIIVRKEFA